jgi:SAM-dependent methyltransferase
MNDWSAGYVDQIDYTYGYCDELNPLRAALPLLLAGHDCVAPKVACELGYGHGVSVNLHAAASGLHWHGTDFNPKQAGFARALAEAAGSGAVLSDERFTEYCLRDDLPDFDFIGMHGLWSWVSADNRARLIEFAVRKLKPGGVLYVSYNALPGWSPMLPVRELMYRHFDAAAAHEPDVAVRIGAALAYARDVFATQPTFERSAGLGLAARVKGLADESVSYLAHEYFNRDWQPMAFGEVAALLHAAGLAYGGSAHYRDHFDALNLTARQRAQVDASTDPVLRETVRDLCMNQSFRRDYWVKPAARLEPGALAERLRAQRVVLALPRERVVLKAHGALGEADLPAALYGPLLDALSHYRPMSLAELETAVPTMPLAHIAQAAMLLVSIGALMVAQDDAAIEAARPVTERLNRALCERARSGGQVQFLASPVTGAGLHVPRIAQLFLLASMSGLESPQQWAGFARDTLAASADGTPVPSLGELAAQAQRYAVVQWPVLRSLQVG